MPRRSHAVLHREMPPPHGCRHVVQEGVAVRQVEIRLSFVVQPVLLVGGHAGVRQVSGNGFPVRRVRHHIPRHPVQSTVGAAGVDPSGVRDERHTEVPLKRRESGHERRCGRFVSINARPVVVPQGGAALGIKPTVQLQVPERDAGQGEIALHRVEGLLVAHRAGHVVVVCGAVVGPVADLVQAHIGIVGGPRLTAERGERLSPRVEGAVDSLLDHQQRPVFESERQSGDIRRDPARQLAIDSPGCACRHEIRGWRENKGPA